MQSHRDLIRKYGHKKLQIFEEYTQWKSLGLASILQTLCIVKNYLPLKVCSEFYSYITPILDAQFSWQMLNPHLTFLKFTVVK